MVTCRVALGNSVCELLKFRWYKKWYKNPVEATWLPENYLYIRGIEELSGGGTGIRTLDRLLTYAGFQDRCIQPLCHPSAA